MTGSPGIDQTAALGTVADFLKEQQENLQKGVQPVVPDFPPNSTGHTKKYQYVDAKRINDGLVKEKDVNFFGVISDWEEPRRTRGPDMIESLKLVDPTGSIEARIFAKDMDGLPKPRKPGDIIRLHRVLVASYRNQAGDVSYSLVASTTKMRSSWALFDAEVVNEKDKYTPYNHSHDNFNMSRFCMRIIDVSRVVSSTGIWKKDLATALQQTNDTWRRQIKSALVSNGPNFWDLIALVVAVEKDDYHDQLNQTIVWVWDGTNAPAYPPSSDTRGLEKPHTEEELKLMSLS